jgi:hypothetical protein
VFNGIFNALNLKGQRDCALAAFALAASRLPWAENQKLTWKDEPALSLLLGPVAKNAALFLFPFFKPVSISYQASLDAGSDALKLSSGTHLKGMGMKLKGLQARVELSRADGIIQISLLRDDKEILQARQCQNDKQISEVIS